MGMGKEPNLSTKINIGIKAISIPIILQYKYQHHSDVSKIFFITKIRAGIANKKTGFVSKWKTRRVFCRMESMHDLQFWFVFRRHLTRMKCSKQWNLVTTNDHIYTNIYPFKLNSWSHVTPSLISTCIEFMYSIISLISLELAFKIAFQIAAIELHYWRCSFNKWGLPLVLLIVCAWAFS